MWKWRNSFSRFILTAPVMEGRRAERCAAPFPSGPSCSLGLQGAVRLVFGPENGKEKKMVSVVEEEMFNICIKRVNNVGSRGKVSNMCCYFFLNSGRERPYVFMESEDFAQRWVTDIFCSLVKHPPVLTALSTEAADQTNIWSDCSGVTQSESYSLALQICWLNIFTTILLHFPSSSQ